MKKLGFLLALVVIAGMASAQTTIFSDNMTNFPTGWTLSPSSGGWTKVSNRYYSSSYSARGDNVNPYAANQNNYMTRSVNLSSYSSATLTFYLWQYTESGYDYIRVQYYSGSTWTTAWQQAGSYQSWTQKSVSIPTTATQIRFWFYSDGSVQNEGVYIDDVVLRASGGTVTQNDAGSGGDAGNTFATALQVNPGSWSGCYLSSTDTTDYYKFNVSTGQQIKVKITPGSGLDFDLYLYNPSQTQKASSTAGAGVADSCVFTADATGYWYAKAKYYSGTAGNYGLLISVSGSTPSPTLAVSMTSWSVAAAGGTSSAVSVTNSATSDVISYTVSSNQTWLTVSATSGSTPGSFTMTAAANTSTSSRTATVTVTATSPSGTQGSPKTITVTQAAASGGTAEWTIMVYLNADNDLEQYGIDDFIEMANASYSSGKINLIVQMDRASGYDSRYDNWTTCKRFKIANGMTPTAANQLSDIGEVDMGNPTTLVNFATWAITNYPANRYSLILWDHGDGWYKGEDGESALFRGFSNDNSHGSVIGVANGQLASALSQIKSHLGRNLDHIGWDACLMGMWEVLDIAKNYANVANVSEETEGAAGWYYTTWLNNLNTTPTMSAIDMGKAIINGTSGQSTLSVVDLTQIADLNTKVSAFADQLMAARGAGYSSAINTALSNTLKFSPSYFSYHIDLSDFATKVKAQITAIPALTTACDNVISAVSNAVKLYKNSSSYTNARGIAIYHNSSTSNYNTSYNNLPICASTSWDEYLKGGSSGGGSTANYTKSTATYSWVTTSTSLGLTGDDAYKAVSLPFTFNFYGTNYTSINVCTNGFLNFGTSSTAYSPATIPNTAAPNALLAVLWRDLNADASTSITYSSSTSQFVVTFSNIKNYSNTNRQTFQVILYPDGKIKYQWQTVTNDVTTSIGVENQGGTLGVSHSSPTNGSAILFTPPASWSSPAQGGDDPLATRLNRPEIPTASALMQNAPNPVQGKTYISYQLAQPGHTTLKVYNLNGQLVRTLVDASQPAGYYDISWDARDDAGRRVAAGVYLYKVTSGNYTESRKMVVMK